MQWRVVLMVATSWSLLGYDEVVNQRRPQGPPMTVKFVPDLRFGTEEEEDRYIWPSSATTVTVDDKGHIYVVDVGENQVLEFDDQGKFLRVVAAEGKGPGEFQGLAMFTILQDGSSVGLDVIGGQFGVVKYFDKGCNFKSAKNPQTANVYPNSAIFSPNGDYFAALYARQDAERRKLVTKMGILDPKYNEVKTFSESAEDFLDPAKFGDPNYWAEIIARRLQVFYRQLTVFNFDAEGHLYSAPNNLYEVTKWSPDFSKKLMVVKRDYQPIPMDETHLNGLVDLLSELILTTPALQKIVTRAVLEKAVALSEPPPVKAPIFGLIPMEGGGLLVVHDIDFGTGRQQADLFDGEGRFLGTVEMDQRAFLAMNNALLPKMIFRKGFAYTVETDDMGDNRVVRYRYSLVPRS